MILHILMKIPFFPLTYGLDILDRSNWDMKAITLVKLMMVSWLRKS